MERDIKYLSQHFMCVALSNLSLVEAKEYQYSALKIFGDVSVKSLTSWKEAIQFIQPLRTFPKRYILAEIGDWVLVYCDMIGENCMVDVLFHAIKSGCNAAGGIAVNNSKTFFYIENGKIQREIECYKEDDWYVRERGLPLVFENEGIKRKERSKYMRCLFMDYIYKLTGVRFPLDFSRHTTNLIGFERSWSKVQVLPKELSIQDDISTFL